MVEIAKKPSPRGGLKPLILLSRPIWSVEISLLSCGGPWLCMVGYWNSQKVSFAILNISKPVQHACKNIQVANLEEIAIMGYITKEQVHELAIVKRKTNTDNTPFDWRSIMTEQFLIRISSPQNWSHQAWWSLIFSARGPCGWFKENFQKEKMLPPWIPWKASLQKAGLQKQYFHSLIKNVLRGLHAEPWDKCISVANEGKVLGTWVDLREGDSFKEHLPNLRSIASKASSSLVNCSSQWVPKFLTKVAYTYLIITERNSN